MISRPTHWQVTTPEGWDAVARDVAAMLHPGSILALQGPLGVGKTTFVQALARVMGAATTPKSPTFSMLRTYPVRQGNIRRLLHVDAYRIEHERDLLPLDLDDELAAGDAMLVLEWPEQIPQWLKDRRVSTLSITMTKDGREAFIVSPAPRQSP
jgi:tRNA threonylcarbamoyladenosine biosynthesis protein TsaE